MIKAESRLADGAAKAAPKSVPGQNISRIPQRHRPAQAASKPRRRIAPTFWSAVNAHLARERQGLPPDSPRVRPTLPKLRLRELA
jgi:hypothetical protein